MGRPSVSSKCFKGREIHYFSKEKNNGFTVSTGLGKMGVWMIPSSDQLITRRYWPYMRYKILKNLPDMESLAAAICEGYPMLYSKLGKPTQTQRDLTGVPGVLLGLTLGQHCKQTK